MITLFDGSAFQFIHGGKPNYEYTLQSHIEGVLSNCNSHEYIGFIDGKDNYRKKVAKTKVYKGNRKKGDLLERFPYFFKVKELLLGKYQFKVVNGIEADDAVAILQTRFSNKDIRSIIASTDKDLLQIPGYHYDVRQHKRRIVHEYGTIELSNNRKKVLATGDKLLFAQMLMGDSTDNIGGLKGCGPVGTVAALKNLSTAECMQKVFDMYLEQDGHVDRMIETFKLVYILRKNVNFKTPEIIDYMNV